ncbi:MAG: tRNA pseudouridine(55) synthase TruB [Kiritimatiellia bacterium]|jgi:tRNA pseudouridine55 synthase
MPKPKYAPAPDIDGLLLIDKPTDFTSHDVVAVIRRHLRQRKVGHGGTLDPNATGLLVILLGRGTSLSDRVMGGDKLYTGTLLLGRETTTQDIEGETVAEKPFDAVTPESLAAAMDSFRGDQYQTPPMASAVKIRGVRLYKLARQGESVAREPRFIHVYRFLPTAVDPPRVSFEVLCSKGTYVRTLCHDLGRKLGCGACMESLRRVRSGSLDLSRATPLHEALEMDPADLAERVIPCTSYLAD